MIELLPDEFEQELAELMNERASRLRVESSPVRETAHTNSPSRRPWILAAAAVLLIVLGLAGLNRWSERDDSRFVDSAASSALETELVIWIEQSATPGEIDEVAATLESLSSVVRFTYVDRSQTFAEFEEYFAESPEVLLAVEPEDLPVSFRVETNDPKAVTDAVQDLAGVRQVDIGSDQTSDPGWLFPAAALESVVMIDPDVSLAYLQRVHAAVEELSSTRSAYPVSTARSLEKFAEFFDDYPALRTQIEDADLRPSVRVVTEDIVELRRTVDGMPGVLFVTGSSVPADPDPIFLLPANDIAAAATVESAFGPETPNVDAGQALLLASDTSQDLSVVRQIDAPSFSDPVFLTHSVGDRMVARDVIRDGRRQAAEPLADGTWLQYLSPVAELDDLIASTRFTNGRIIVDNPAFAERSRIDDISGGASTWLTLDEFSGDRLFIRMLAHGTIRSEEFWTLAETGRPPESEFRVNGLPTWTGSVVEVDEDVTWTSVGWYPDEGRWVSVSGSRSLEELVEIAEGLQEVDEATWRAWVDDRSD